MIKTYGHTFDLDRYDLTRLESYKNKTMIYVLENSVITYIKCLTCNFSGFTSDGIIIYEGNSYNVYELSCAEQVIKNILE